MTLVNEIVNAIEFEDMMKHTRGCYCRTSVERGKEMKVLVADSVEIHYQSRCFPSVPYVSFATLLKCKSNE